MKGTRDKINPKMLHLDLFLFGSYHEQQAWIKDEHLRTEKHQTMGGGSEVFMLMRWHLIQTGAVLQKSLQL